MDEGEGHISRDKKNLVNPPFKEKLPENPDLRLLYIQKVLSLFCSELPYKN